MDTGKIQYEFVPREWWHLIILYMINSPSNSWSVVKTKDFRTGRCLSREWSREEGREVGKRERKPEKGGVDENELFLLWGVPI